MAERKALSKKIRFEVFKRDKFTCQYCGKKAPDVVLEVDHIKPVAEGGNNDILNLVTSCMDCNRGKGKIRLDDNSEITKQQAELQRLAERNEQLEMLIEWRKALLDYKENEVDKILKYFEELNNCTVNEYGKSKINKWIKEFSIEELLDAIDIASDKCLDCENAFNQIPRIANVKKRAKNDPQLYYFNYIKKCLKDGYYYINYARLHSLVYENVFNDDDFEIMKNIFKQSRNWTIFVKKMEGFFGCEE